jgi:hypothetical protein
MKTFKSVFGLAANKEESKEKTKKPKVKEKTKTKAKTKEKVEPKKRGRPTNAELAAKAKEKRNTEIALRKELIERQKAATVSGSVTTVEYNENDERVYPEYKTDFSTKVKDPNWIPPWPIFLPGQRVEYIVKKKDGKTYKGTIVGIDDIQSAFIRVAWDDGSSQYHAKQALKLIEKKVYKSLLKGKKDQA